MTNTQDNFANHVELIKAQDGLTDEGDARWRAWTEGPHGYARRLKPVAIPEGYYDITHVSEDVDVDHGGCTRFVVPEINMVFFLYDDIDVVSFHAMKPCSTAV